MPKVKTTPQFRSKPKSRVARGAQSLEPLKPFEPIAPKLFVTSAPLVSQRSRELSEFDFGLITAGNAFNRWVARCMAAAVLKDLTTLGALLLHHANPRAREKKLADVCFIMNIEDSHVVSYSLKKRTAMKLVESEKRGKGVEFFTTKMGQEYIQRYREVREACLVASLSKGGSENAKLGELASFLRMLSGRYDQAARAATSL